MAQAAPGVVVVLSGPGVYLSGPLLLNGSAHLTLRIEAGATLASAGIALARASRWPIVPGLYPAAETAARRGRDYAPILWLLGVQNVVVEGGGMVHGGGEDGWWQTALRPPLGPKHLPRPGLPRLRGLVPAPAAALPLPELQLRHAAVRRASRFTAPSSTTQPHQLVLQYSRAMARPQGRHLPPLAVLGDALLQLHGHPRPRPACGQPGWRSKCVFADPVRARVRLRSQRRRHRRRALAPCAD